MRARRQPKEAITPAYQTMLSKSKILKVESDGEQLEAALATLVTADEVTVLGFDLEWKPDAGSVPVALVQLSGRSTTVIIQLHKFSEFPKALRDILEDRDILKVGVACLQDAQRLFRASGVLVKGCIELAELIHRSEFDPSICGSSLASLCHHILRIELDKSIDIRCGDWEAKELSAHQTLYAAADAFYARKLFVKMFLSKKSRQWHRQDMQAFFQGLTDTKPVRRVAHAEPGSSHGERIVVKRKLPMTAMKRPAYDNCTMVDVDGEFMCSTSRRKMEWYIQRNLAEVLQDEPTVYRLRFTPNGPGNKGSEFFMEAKVNCCVVCGSLEALSRMHVVPLSFRRHFPEKIKSHSCHDSVLTCVSCAANYSHSQRSLRQTLMDEAKCKESIPRLSQDHKTRNQAILAAQTLQKQFQLPSGRRLVLRQQVALFLGKTEADLTDEDLSSVAPLSRPVARRAYDESQVIVEELCGDDVERIHEFARRWRQHFLDSMKPRHLSKHWSVDHRKPNDDHDDPFGSSS